MYAVIETGGKQYRVEVGTELEVELLDVEPGQTLTLERVLLVGDGADTAVGRPVVADAAVEAEVVRRDRGDKLIVFKYRPKARRRVKKGHRQEHTILRVTDVKLGDKSAAALVAKREQEAKTERERLEEAAARQAAEDAALAAKLAKRSQTAKAPPATSERGATAEPTARVQPTGKAAPTKASEHTEAIEQAEPTERDQATRNAAAGKTAERVEGERRTSRAKAQEPPTAGPSPVAQEKSPSARRTKASGGAGETEASDPPKRRGRTKKDE